VGPDESRLPHRFVVIPATTLTIEEEEDHVLDEFEAEIEREYVSDLCNGNIKEIPDEPLENLSEEDIMLTKPTKNTQIQSPTIDFEMPTPPVTPDLFENTEEHRDYWARVGQSAYNFSDDDDPIEDDDES